MPMACGDEFGISDLLDSMKAFCKEQVILTVKADESNSQQRFFKGLGMMRMPVTWSDENQRDYEVYTKGHIEMGGFVNLMERVEFIGKEIVYW